MQIAIQGAAGSFHHQAALQLDPQAQIVPQTTFTDVFKAVANGDVANGLCAVENNIHGSINEVYRLLERYHVWITADVRLHIAQQLIGPEAVSLAELQAAGDVRVLSQAPALAQVELWLDEHLPNATRQETHDTADSVRLVTEQADSHVLAVASSFAAETYGGVIVAANIQDEPDNYTRFILFQKDRAEVVGVQHASIILRTDHTPGALLRALQIFAEHDCNITKLDSHPITGDQRHYAFYVDYELPTAPNVELISQLESQGCQVKLLGEYVSK